MKKLLILLGLIVLFSLIGCSEKNVVNLSSTNIITDKLSFDDPTSNIVLDKDIVLGESGLSSTYKSIVLEESDDIELFFNNLSQITYVIAEGVCLDISGYSYVISFDDTDICFVGEYFYYNGIVCKMISGSISFLDNYNWQME